MIKPLKVLQLIDSLDAGGAEMMAVNIANALADKGIDSYLCATRKEGLLKEKIQPNVSYLFLNKKSTLDFRAIFRLKKFIQKNKIQLIHAHSSSYFIGFLVKILNPSVQLIWHDHYGKSELLNHRKKGVLKLSSYSFSWVISVNENLYWWAKQNLKAKNYVYLTNFAQLSNYRDNATLLKGIEKKRIVCLANLRTQKDHLNLLKAFKIVVKENAGWTLHLVGLDLYDVYSTMLKKYVFENELTNIVHFYGSCSDTTFILKQATIGVLSSKSEGLPLALLEYGLARLPVIVTNVGDCSLVIDTNVNGFVVQPNDSNEFAEKLEKLMINDDLRVIFGNNLFTKITKSYSKDSYINQLIALYQN